MTENEVKYESLDESQQQALKQEFVGEYPQYEKLVNEQPTLAKGLRGMWLAYIPIILAFILGYIGFNKNIDFLFISAIVLIFVGGIMLWVFFIKLIKKSKLRAKKENDFCMFLETKGISYKPKANIGNMAEMMNAIKNKSKN